MTLFDVLIVVALSLGASVAARYGFTELLGSLVGMYLVLCGFQCTSFYLTLTRNQREEFANRWPTYAVHRPWLCPYPPCGLRDLCFYSKHFVLVPMVGLFSYSQARDRGALHPVWTVDSVGVAILSISLCIGGLMYLWEWIPNRVGATQDRPALLSKPVEICVCYLLLIAGFVWMSLGIYIPILYAYGP